MRMDMSQGMRQDMVLSPQMIQSMEILQLPVMQLEERIREEIEKNPVLEAGASPAEVPSTDFEAKYGDAPADGETAPAPGEVVSKREERIANERDAFEQMYEEYNDTYIPPHQPSKWAGVELSDKKQDAMLNMADRPEALEDHLLHQLPFQDAEPLVKRFCEHIIANLNEKGWLASSLDELRRTFDESVTEEEADDALFIVQQLDPAGVGARDLQECLVLQLDDPRPALTEVEVLRDLLMNHFDDVMHRRLAVLEKKSGFEIEEIRGAFDDLRHLTPNPASAFQPAPTQYVVPDLRLTVDDDGEYKVKVVDENLPSVYINPQYLESLKAKQSDDAAKEYVRKKVQQGQWLIQAIKQRRTTLQKVAKAIVDHQRDFLEHGPEQIHPLKMQHIADRVGVAVTTISRAVNDKWIETPKGVFPLRQFFHSGTITADGKEVAYDTIKRRLQETIDGENKAEPLSDEDLENKLAELGFKLARRTITKYRKELNIPSSRERKKV